MGPEVASPGRPPRTQIQDLDVVLSREAGCALVGAHHVESLVMTLAGQVLDEVHSARRYGSIDPGGVVGVKACQSFLYWCRRHQHLPLRPKPPFSLRRG